MTRPFVISCTILICLFFGAAKTFAHEMIPTYPRWEISHVQGLLTTTLKMFNKRQEVEYYEIGVFDQNWNPVPFVSSYSVIKVEYLGHVTFDLYIRNSDKDRALYICSISKIKKTEDVRTAITSRICSKTKDG